MPYRIYKVKIRIYNEELVPTPRGTFQGFYLLTIPVDENLIPIWNHPLSQELLDEAKRHFISYWKGEPVKYEKTLFLWMRGSQPYALYRKTLHLSTYHNKRRLRLAISKSNMDSLIKDGAVRIFLETKEGMDEVYPRFRRIKDGRLVLPARFVEKHGLKPCNDYPFIVAMPADRKEGIAYPDERVSYLEGSWEYARAQGIHPAQVYAKGVPLEFIARAEDMTIEELIIGVSSVVPHPARKSELGVWWQEAMIIKRVDEEIKIVWHDRRGLIRVYPSEELLKRFIERVQSMEDVSVEE